MAAGSGGGGPAGTLHTCPVWPVMTKSSSPNPSRSSAAPPCACAVLPVAAAWRFAPVTTSTSLALPLLPLPSTTTTSLSGLGAALGCLGRAAETRRALSMRGRFGCGWTSSSLSPVKSTIRADMRVDKSVAPNDAFEMFKWPPRPRDCQGVLAVSIFLNSRYGKRC